MKDCCHPIGGWGRKQKNYKVQSFPIYGPITAQKTCLVTVFKCAFLRGDVVVAASQIRQYYQTSDADLQCFIDLTPIKTYIYLSVRLIYEMMGSALNYAQNLS